MAVATHTIHTVEYVSHWRNPRAHRAIGRQAGRPRLPECRVPQDRIGRGLALIPCRSAPAGAATRRARLPLLITSMIPAPLYGREPRSIHEICLTWRIRHKVPDSRDGSATCSRRLRVESDQYYHVRRLCSPALFVRTSPVFQTGAGSAELSKRSVPHPPALNLDYGHDPIAVCCSLALNSDVPFF